MNYRDEYDELARKFVARNSDCSLAESTHNIAIMFERLYEYGFADKQLDESNIFKSSIEYKQP